MGAWRYTYNMSKPECRWCGSAEHAVLRRDITSNGRMLIYWFCAACQRRSQYGANWLPHWAVAVYLRQWDKVLTDIPVWHDNRAGLV